MSTQQQSLLEQNPYLPAIPVDPVIAAANKAGVRLTDGASIRETALEVIRRYALLKQDRENISDLVSRIKQKAHHALDPNKVGFQEEFRRKSLSETYDMLLRLTSMLQESPFHWGGPAS